MMGEEDASVVYWDVVDIKNGKFKVVNDEGKVCEWTGKDVVLHGLQPADLRKSLALKKLKAEVDAADNFQPYKGEIWHVNRNKSAEETENDFMGTVVMLEALRIHKAGTHGRFRAVAESMEARGFNLGAKPVDKVTNRFSNLYKLCKAYERNRTRPRPQFYDLVIMLAGRDVEPSSNLEIDDNDESCDPPVAKVARRSANAERENLNDSEDVTIQIEFLNGFSPLKDEVWLPNKQKNFKEIENDNTATAVMIEALKKYKGAKKYGKTATCLLSLGFNLGSKPSEKVANKLRNLQKTYRMRKKELEETGVSRRPLPPYFESLCELEGESLGDIQTIAALASKDKDTGSTDGTFVAVNEKEDIDDIVFKILDVLNGYKPTEDEIWTMSKSKTEKEQENNDVAVRVLLELVKVMKDDKHKFRKIAHHMERFGFNLGTAPVDKLGNKYSNLLRPYKRYVHNFENGIHCDPPPFADVLSEIEGNPKEMGHLEICNVDVNDDGTDPFEDLKHSKSDRRSESSSSEDESVASESFDEVRLISGLSHSETSAKNKKGENLMKKCFETLTVVEKNQRDLVERSDKFFRDVVNELRTLREEQAVREERRLAQMDKMLELLSNLTRKSDS